MNRNGRRLLADATYQISKLYAFLFQRRIFKFSFFVPMFQFVTSWVPEASYGQTW